MKQQNFVIVVIGFTIILLFSFACSPEKEESKSEYKILYETRVKEIELIGIGSERFIEASGLAWFGDYLIILPQYPHKVSKKNDGALLYLTRAEIEAYLFTDSKKALEPRTVKLIAEGLDSLGKRRGSGYEAVTIKGNDIYLTIESIDNEIASSYLVAGKIFGDLDSIVVTPSFKYAITSNSGLFNIGEESIINYNNEIICIHEANGKNNTMQHSAFVLNTADFTSTKIDFPVIEYRITDATSVDSLGNFWVVNYYYPGEESLLKPSNDYYSEKYGIGRTNYRFSPIERLIKLQIVGNKIRYTNEAPIYLELGDDKGSNWEGIVELEGKGFLIITDYYPRTLFAFVKYP